MTKVFSSTFRRKRPSRLVPRNDSPTKRYPAKPIVATPVESSNDIRICCPKCHAPGILYSDRSITALIGSHYIAHVLHPATEDNPTRRACLLTRTEFQSISPRRTSPENRLNPDFARGLSFELS